MKTTDHTIESHTGVYSPFGRWYTPAGDQTDSLIVKAAAYNTVSSGTQFA